MAVIIYKYGALTMELNNNQVLCYYDLIRTKCGIFTLLIHESTLSTFLCTTKLYYILCVSIVILLISEKFNLA